MITLREKVPIQLKELKEILIKLQQTNQKKDTRN
jgi:hypothetical protein